MNGRAAVGCRSQNLTSTGEKGRTPYAGAEYLLQGLAAAGRAMKHLLSILLVLVAAPQVCVADGVGDVWIGRNALLAGDDDTAIRLFSRALNDGLTPEATAAALILRGAAYHEKGFYDKAIADYSEGLRLKPKPKINNIQAHVYRGNALVEKQLYDQAIADYDEALRLDPAYVGAYMGRGIAYERQGFYDKALMEFDAALKVDPNNPWALLARGGADFKRGLYNRRASS